MFHGKTMENSLFLWPCSIAFCMFTRGWLCVTVYAVFTNLDLRWWGIRHVRLDRELRRFHRPWISGRSPGYPWVSPNGMNLAGWLPPWLTGLLRKKHQAFNAGQVPGLGYFQSKQFFFLLFIPFGKPILTIGKNLFGLPTVKIGLIGLPSKYHFFGG